MTVTEIIVIAVLIVIIGCIIVCNVVFRGNNSASSLFGYSFYKTQAVNMLPEIPVNSVVVAKKSEIENIRQGSVILCNIGGRTALTRVAELQEENGTSYYIVKFDTSPDNETFRVSRDDVIAKAVWQLDNFGKFLDFATSVPGIAATALIPIIIIIAFQATKMHRLSKLEKLASTMDGIEDIFAEKNRLDPFEEVKQPERREKKIIPEAPPADSVLTVDRYGKADYTAIAEKKEKPESPLFTYNRETGRAAENIEPTEPTKIAAESHAKKEPELSFASHLSNVIPDRIVGIQESAVEKARDNESFDAFFEKAAFGTVKDKPAEPVQKLDEPPIIPEKAVVPKENIAPVKKRSTSKTIADLMSIIDAEESKLKK